MQMSSISEKAFDEDMWKVIIAERELIGKLISWGYKENLCHSYLKK